MDFETQRKKRMEALEDKRRRLEEMRKSRKDRTEPTEEVQENQQIAVDERTQVDNLVNSLLISSINEPNTESITATDSMSPRNDDASSDNFSSSSSAHSGKNMLVTKKNFAYEKAKSLSICKAICIIDILPTFKESYDKECQTEADNDYSVYREEDSIRVDMNAQTPRRPSSRGTTVGSTGRAAGSNTKMHLSMDLIGHSVSATPGSSSSPSTMAQKDTHSTLQDSPLISRKLLSTTETSAIIAREDFGLFMESASRIIERTLDQNSTNVDIFRNYKNDDKIRFEDQILSIETVYEDESVRTRPVMYLQSSPHFSELFLAAYGSKGHGKGGKGPSSLGGGGGGGGGENESPGMVAVWSQVTPSRPEFKFSASSPVLCARFHTQDAHLIVGGCYSGQILLWDLRMKSLPVQRSSMSVRSHRHPVYSMCMSGQGSALELVTASTDGTLCQWDTSRLNEPTNVSTLTTPNSSQSRKAPSQSLSGENSVNVSSMAFSRDDSAKDVIFGSDSGQLYRSSVPFGANDPLLQINAHHGLVTSIHKHPYTTRPFKHLVLTSSLDWSVKLWNLQQSEVHPLFQFGTSSYDYVCDVQWSPSHPAVFSTITSGGALSLWNLSKSTSEPVETLRFFKDFDEQSPGGIGSGPAGQGSGLGTTGGRMGGGGSSSGAGALNKSIWSKDGRSILVGDAKGSVHLVSVQENSVKSSQADTTRFELALQNTVTSQEASESQESPRPSSAPGSPVPYDDDDEDI